MELSNKAATEFVWPGRVTQVVDPHYFWMQLGTKENLFQFDHLQNDLQKFARQSWAPTSSVDELEPGMVVLVDTDTDSQTRWKRGQIAGIMHGNSVDVFYVDYGNTELTTVDKICTNMPGQFKACPPQAVRCSLAGVKPLVKKWTSRGIKTFQHLTDSSLLNVLVLYGEPGYCEVALYPSEEKGRSVGHCLVTEEVAMMTEEQMVPEFLQNIPAFMKPGFPDSSPGADTMSPTRPEEHTDAEIKTQTPPSTEKYIPPHQKSHGSPPGSAGSSLNSHGTSLHSSPSNSSGHRYLNSKPSSSTAQFSNNKIKEPVNDFFPFDNVSVYPPSPSSPVKSPVKGNGYDQSVEGQNSYFSRSPKYNQYGNNTGYRQRENERYTGNMASNAGYHRQPYQGRQHEKSRFAANFDNLPQASNTFDPGYLNQQRDMNSESANHYNNFSSPVKNESVLHRSPNKSFSDSDTSPRSRPRLKIPGSHSSHPPFYPPDQRGEGTGGYALPKAWNLAPPQVYEQSNPQQGLHPPAYYQHNIPPPPLNQSDQYFNHIGQSVSPVKQHPHSGIDASSPTKMPHHNDSNVRSRNQSVNGSYQDLYNKHNQNPSHTTGSPSNSYVNQYYDHNNSNVQHQGKSPAKIPTPTTPSKYYGYEPPKMSPESPESPAIAAFNLGDLEHTQMTSADHFHQQHHQERLQALQEEAEDIARESKEQSELVDYSRYGARGQHDDIPDYAPVLDQFDVFDQIAQEIHDTSAQNTKEPDELKKSPVTSSAWKSTEAESTMKLEGIPKSYIADINFTEAVREALESGRTDMENTRLLLRDIIESLRLAEAAKQLYDVLMLLLAKAVKEYDLFHTVVMETIVSLNEELEIKECLSKALRRQQELCVRVPAPRKPQHITFARVMAHIYNMALEWSDSNASIQDGVLVTVEKWIVFNSKTKFENIVAKEEIAPAGAISSFAAMFSKLYKKEFGFLSVVVGSQIGQVDKENVFLDCFEAFWEVSGDKLVRHNQTFRSRIQDEMRQKLLNEGVSRSVRERLLDMTLEMFSHNVEKQDTCTQTQHRTMIPSSCQVRPSTCDKATFMESEWQDDGFTNLDPEKLEMNWQVNAADYASPDSVLSLRPLGRGKPTIQKQSTPGNSFSADKTNESFGTPTQDLSRNSEFNESVYVTPNESFATDSGRDKPRFNDMVKGTNERSSPCSYTDRTRTSSLQSQGEKSVHSDSGVAEAIEETSAIQAVVKVGEKVNQNTGRTSVVQKKAMGKSLVDWFDYEPSSSDSERSGAKIVEKRLETRKKLDSTSREIIENDVALKYAPTKDLTKRKPKKEKEKKVVRQSGNVVVEERKVESNRLVENSKELSEECAYEHQMQQAIIESLKTENISNDVEVRRNVDSVKEDIDWWGVGEAADTRYFADSVIPPVEDNIYIDNGPDVIIEDEFEQAGNYDFGNNQNDAGNIEIGSDSIGATYNGDIPVNTENKYVENVDTNPSGEENEIGGHNIMLQTRHDDLNFDLDDDDDEEHWDSSNSDDLNVNDWLGLQEVKSEYNEEFPETNLETVFQGRTGNSDGEVKNEVAAGSDYDKKFPKSNFGDFVKVKDEVEAEERPRPSRWVPGRRKCLNCYSEDHTTDKCNKFVLLQ